MTFEEWFDGNKRTLYEDEKWVAKKAWDARQAEIDCLKIELDGANERALMLLNHKNNMVEKMQAKIDELQKRIDEALRELMVYKNIQTAVTTLKGNQNEN